MLRRGRGAEGERGACQEWGEEEGEAWTGRNPNGFQK